MPELPEVETMRRGVAAIVGSRIEDVRLARSTRRPILVSPDIRQFRRLAIGRTVTAVERIGKRVVVCLNGDERIVIEPRMTGLALLASPPTLEHLRVRIRLSGGSAPELLYWDRRGLGSVRLLAPDEFAKLFGPDRLGPDALAVSAELLRGWVPAAGPSRWRCSISGPWQVSATSMPPRSCTTPASIPKPPAMVCAPLSGGGCRRQSWRCCETRSSTKARLCPMARIATR